MTPLRPMRLPLVVAVSLLFAMPAVAQDDFEPSWDDSSWDSDSSLDSPYVTDDLEAPAKKRRSRRHARPIDGGRYEEEPIESEPFPTYDPTADFEAMEPDARPADRGFRDLPERYDDHVEIRSRTAEEDLRDDDELLEEHPRLAALDEPGHGFSVELVGGALMLDSALGEILPKPNFAGGFHATWQLGRLFRPENELLYRGLHLDVSYLYTTGTEGTREVSVDSSHHHITAAALFGYALGSQPLSVLFYGKLGPALYVMPFQYSVQGVETDFTGFRGGIAYGAGVRGTWYFGDVGIAARVELLRYRRAYLDDSMLGGSLGVAF